jgi:hypothetical protein
VVRNITRSFGEHPVALKVDVSTLVDVPSVVQKLVISLMMTTADLKC